jgi:hypothetical protein
MGMKGQCHRGDTGFFVLQMSPNCDWSDMCLSRAWLKLLLRGRKQSFFTSGNLPPTGR